MTLTYIFPHEYEILLALAWAAPLSTAQVHRLVMPDRHAATVHRTLARLREIDAVLPGPSVLGRVDQTPKHSPHLWSLAPKGFQCIADDFQAPAKLRPIRWAIIKHDLLMSELIVCLAIQGRAVLSGIYVEREVRLDERRLRPICDAIIILRRDPGEDVTPTTPWVNCPPSPTEVIRGYAVEIDRQTEPIATIRAKGQAYRDIWRDSSFYERYGRLPVPLWVVPTQRRLESIARAWLDAWPEGMWLIATEAGLQADVIEEWRQGQHTTRRLLAGWEVNDAPRG